MWRGTDTFCCLTLHWIRPTDNPVLFSGFHEDLGSMFRDVHTVSLSRSFNSGCRVDGVAKQLEASTFSAKHTRRHGARIQSDAELGEMPQLVR